MSALLLVTTLLLRANTQRSYEPLQQKPEHVCVAVRVAMSNPQAGISRACCRISDGAVSQPLSWVLPHTLPSC